MAKKTREEKLQAYIRGCADLLLLKDWDIHYDPHTIPEGDSEAQIPVDDGLMAKVRIHPAFWLKEPEEQRGVILHELCHLHTDRLREGWQRIEDHLRPEEYRLFNREMEEADEHAVQMFMRILAPLVDLPPKFD